MPRDADTLQADVTFELSLAEISRCCGATTEQIRVLVAEGVVSPGGRSQDDWRFGASDLARTRRALRLQSDLGVNPAGAALAVELLEEMQRLRARVRMLESLMIER